MENLLVKIMIEGRKRPARSRKRGWESAKVARTYNIENDVAISVRLQVHNRKTAKGVTVIVMLHDSCMYSLSPRMDKPKKRRSIN